jgi:hypothetical protein
MFVAAVRALETCEYSSRGFASNCELQRAEAEEKEQQQQQQQQQLLLLQEP